jgi:hypothetical protein
MFVLEIERVARLDAAVNSTPLVSLQGKVQSVRLSVRDYNQIMYIKFQQKLMSG